MKKQHGVFKIELLINVLYKNLRVFVCEILIYNMRQ